eukprot:scaffold35013_cov36-Prasinocladus_malaysianus.AAC.1
MSAGGLGQVWVCGVFHLHAVLAAHGRGVAVIRDGLGDVVAGAKGDKSWRLVDVAVCAFDRQNRCASGAAKWCITNVGVAAERAVAEVGHAEPALGADRADLGGAGPTRGKLAFHAGRRRHIGVALQGIVGGVSVVVQLAQAKRGRVGAVNAVKNRGAGWQSCVLELVKGEAADQTGGCTRGGVGGVEVRLGEGGVLGNQGLKGVLIGDLAVDGAVDGLVVQGHQGCQVVNDLIEVAAAASADLAGASDLAGLAGDGYVAEAIGTAAGVTVPADVCLKGLHDRVGVVDDLLLVTQVVPGAAAVAVLGGRHVAALGAVVHGGVEVQQEVEGHLDRPVREARGGREGGCEGHAADVHPSGARVVRLGAGVAVIVIFAASRAEARAGHRIFAPNTVVKIIAIGVDVVRVANGGVAVVSLFNHDHHVVEAGLEAVANHAVAKVAGLGP